MRLLLALALIIIVCMNAFSAFAEPEWCRSDEIVYHWGDNESLVDAKTAIRSLTKRSAVENRISRIKSKTLVVNGKTQTDILDMISEAFVEDVRVIKHEVDKQNSVIREIIEVQIDVSKIELNNSRVTPPTLTKIKEKSNKSTNGYLPTLYERRSLDVFNGYLFESSDNSRVFGLFLTYLFIQLCSTSSLIIFLLIIMLYEFLRSWKGGGFSKATAMSQASTASSNNEVSDLQHIMDLVASTASPYEKIAKRARASFDDAKRALSNNDVLDFAIFLQIVKRFSILNFAISLAIQFIFFYVHSIITAQFIAIMSAVSFFIACLGGPFTDVRSGGNYSIIFIVSIGNPFLEVKLMPYVMLSIVKIFA